MIRFLSPASTGARNWASVIRLACTTQARIAGKRDSGPVKKKKKKKMAKNQNLRSMAFFEDSSFPALAQSLFLKVGHRPTTYQVANWKRPKDINTASQNVLFNQGKKRKKIFFSIISLNCNYND